MVCFAAAFLALRGSDFAHRSTKPIRVAVTVVAPSAGPRYYCIFAALFFILPQECYLSRPFFQSPHISSEPPLTGHSFFRNPFSF